MMGLGRCSTALFADFVGRASGVHVLTELLQPCGLSIDRAAWEAGVGSPKSVNPKHQTPKWGRWSAQQQAFRNFCGEEMQACSHSMQDAIGADAQRVDDRSIRGN